MDSVQQLSRTPGFSAMLKDIDMSNTVRQLWEKVSMDSTLLDSTQLQSASESCRLQAQAGSSSPHVHVHCGAGLCPSNRSTLQHSCLRCAWQQCAQCSHVVLLQAGSVPMH